MFHHKFHEKIVIVIEQDVRVRLFVYHTRNLKISFTSCAFRLYPTRYRLSSLLWKNERFTHKEMWSIVNSALVYEPKCGGRVAGSQPVNSNPDHRRKSFKTCTIDPYPWNWRLVLVRSGTVTAVHSTYLKSAEGSHIMVILSSSGLNSMGQTKYGNCVGDSQYFLHPDSPRFFVNKTSKVFI